MASKRLHFLDRIIYFFNAIVAFLLLISYLLPFISPKYIPFISILNFGIPLLILINFIFLIYWLLKLKKQLILSAVILLIGYSHITSLYIFSEDKKENTHGLKLMSYNVRHFNLYKWITEIDVVESIQDFILEEKPDFIAFQDFNDDLNFDISNEYPFRYIIFNERKESKTTALFSKFPFINQKEIQFENSTNCAIYVDVALQNDTIRLFNIHLESLRIRPDMRVLKNEDANLLVERVSKAFKKQAEQVDLIQPHLEASPYKNIIIGDFNNTAFSYVYRELKTNKLKDAFKEKGRGFGKTFDFDFIPIRIDHALVNEDIDVLNFKNYEIQYSDHYPILVEFLLPENQ